VAIPPGSDLILFLLSDGELNKQLAFEKPSSLGELFKHYESLPGGVKEPNHTLYRADPYATSVANLGRADLGPRRSRLKFSRCMWTSGARKPAVIIAR